MLKKTMIFFPFLPITFQKQFSQRLKLREYVHTINYFNLKMLGFPTVQ